MGLFRKKEEKPYRVLHYEGLDNVGVNIPCTLIIKDNILHIDFNSGMSVTLPEERIMKFEKLNEDGFMMKYKNTNINANNKYNGIKAYLVITYISKENEEKRIVLWTANLREANYFTDLHYKYKRPTGNVEL